MEAFDINQIHITSPCTVPWEAMTGDERARFCKECKLNVYNVATMTKLEAESLFLESEDKACLRIIRRKDGTVMTRDCGPVRAQRFRQRVTAAVASILVLSVQIILWLDRRRTEESSISVKPSEMLKTTHRLQQSKVYELSKPVQVAVDWAQQQVQLPATPTPTVTPNAWRGIEMYE